MRARFILTAGLFLLGQVLQAESVDAILDQLADQMTVSNGSGTFRARLSGSFELEGYAFDRQETGLIRSEDDRLFNPRLVLFLDAQAGPAFYGFAQARLDRGFDPSDMKEELRLDEYVLRWTPWKDGRFSLQAGQFATVVGRWVSRHLAWQNGFVTAPLFYENPTRLSDLNPPPSGYYLTYSNYEGSYDYNPIIWGPSYASGIAASGRWGKLEWAVEAKNSALMSRPEIWPVSETGFAEPTFSGRLAWRPDLRWTLGISASDGAYAGPGDSFPDRGDYRQRLYLVDVSYEHGHLQVWSELAIAEFTAPEVESNLRTQAWFIEARYKLAPRLSLAVRWNEQNFSPFTDYGRNLGPWGVDLQRLDAAITWRFNAHSQIQVEVNSYQAEKEEDRGEVVSARFTLRF